MNIKQNNLFARYYEWIYGNLPNDVCSFFWGSLYAIGLFFIIIPGKFVAPNSDKYSPGAQFFTGLACWLGYAAAVVIGFLTVDGFGYEFTNLWGWLVLGALTGAGVILLLLGLIVGMVYIFVEKLPETTAVQNTKDFVGAVRQKHCTKINWN